ncbi:type IV pilus biogenesis factor PilY1 [Jeongeupia sp. HS-3]|uniref:pilus assembly protein n=1 Tax=Jeongeupia sp. HS-3 TaxID=1009682 RepID=UPI0018A5BAA0|nr:PilC/PilY family type IV pilus protein [Jeongeupia sp. HS-3]BCL76823.1 type IV pilus biogenesis factor PilY1 [Jeongeupia sp. HS-3]
MARRHPLICLAPLALTLLTASVQAALTDLANSPITSASKAEAKPNVLFILDDSGSMDWDYLPDGLNNQRNMRCFGYHGYNKAFYDPNTTYTPPIKADGTSFPNVSFTSAPSDGFTGSENADLSNLRNLSVGTVENDAGNRSKYYYSTLKSDKKTNCEDSNYNLVTVLPNDTQKQNYANWYSYYRKRIFLARTAASKAFKPFGDKFRIGFSTIHNSGATEGSKLLHVRDFDQSQKNEFYNRLFNADPGSATPLRAALSTAGRYYAKKLDDQDYDPVQYSCQKNFTILSTDGYWNTDNEGGSFGPKKLNGSSDVGNQDGGSTEAPFFDKLGKSDTLADVAMYYYNTDLRTNTLGNCSGSLGGSINVCLDPGDNSYDVQRMVTHTIGLGLTGTIRYESDYDTSPDPVPNGSKDKYYTQIAQGSINWPDPISNSGGERLDDLWHAAVNGRGHYYSANDATELANSLSDALTKIEARSGSAAAAATSNLEPVAGDNYVYVALYRTQEWYGDLIAVTLDVNTGSVALKLDNATGEPQAGSYAWSAKSQLAAKIASASDSRSIYFFDGSQSNKLRSFDYDNLNGSQKANFDDLCGSVTKLSQCSELASADKALVTGANVVKYLRGQNQYEGSETTTQLFRKRTHRLGDIVNAVPVYMKAPPFQYVDDGYATFVTQQKNRAASVYAAANDGMLHAFDASSGDERWAYIPSMVMPRLHKLLDRSYGNNHEYFVDGSPTIADVKIGNNWKTVIVGGLNKGGRGYYALDVTDPSAPKALWEFTHDNLGHSFGNPIVTKLADGKWVAIVSSGYNNVNPGDGNGHLFIIDIGTGNLVSNGQINTYTSGTTKAGDTNTPSGLAKLNAWISNELDNTASRIYGGDLLGNVWRFDINDTIAPSGHEATLIAQLKDTTGNTQPITTKPELARLSKAGTNYNTIFVGTGRYLGIGDPVDKSQQSLYAFKDELTSTGLGNLRQRSDMVNQVISDATNAKGESIRTASSNPVDWASKSGWYFDLKSPGERVNIDMQQQYNILTFAGNVPTNSSVCTIGGGYAWLYNIDIYTGSNLSTATDAKVGQRLTNEALVAGLKTVKLPSGKTVTIVTDTGAGVTAKEDPSATGGGLGTPKRTSWRELVD